MMRSLIALALVVMAGVVSSAHHSFSATYETGKQVKIDGTIAQFVYRNPHSFVHVEEPDSAGAPQRWAIEWSGTAQLTGQGIKRDTLKVGDKVAVVGRPSRVPGEYRLLMVSLLRASDGFSWGRNGGEVVD